MLVIAIVFREIHFFFNRTLHSEFGHQYTHISYVYIPPRGNTVMCSNIYRAIVFTHVLVSEFAVECSMYVVSMQKFWKPHFLLSPVTWQIFYNITRVLGFSLGYNCQRSQSISHSIPMSAIRVVLSKFQLMQINAPQVYPYNLSKRAVIHRQVKWS